jgi:hypothetical protein
MAGKHKPLIYLRSKNKFIKDFTFTYRSTTVKFVGGYVDPRVIPTSGVRYKGVKEVVVGELFLLGKIF